MFLITFDCVNILLLARQPSGCIAAFFFKPGIAFVLLTIPMFGPFTTMYPDHFVNHVGVLNISQHMFKIP